MLAAVLGDAGLVGGEDFGQGGGCDVHDALRYEEVHEERICFGPSAKHDPTTLASQRTGVYVDGVPKDLNLTNYLIFTNISFSSLELHRSEAKVSVYSPASFCAEFSGIMKSTQKVPEHVPCKAADKKIEFMIPRLAHQFTTVALFLKHKAKSSAGSRPALQHQSRGSVGVLQERITEVPHLLSTRWHPSLVRRLRRQLAFKAHGKLSETDSLSRIFVEFNFGNSTCSLFTGTVSVQDTIGLLYYTHG